MERAISNGASNEQWSKQQPGNTATHYSKHFSTQWSKQSNKNNSAKQQRIAATKIDQDLNKQLSAIQERTTPLPSRILAVR